MALDKKLSEKLDILTSRSSKLRSKMEETNLPKGIRRKAIKLWNRIFFLIHEESKKINDERAESQNRQ